jgi:hypothetical protein
VPGTPKNEAPYNNGKQRGHKRFVSQEERQQKIDAAMAKMPQMIADYRVRGWLAAMDAGATCVCELCNEHGWVCGRVRLGAWLSSRADEATLCMGCSRCSDSNAQACA